MDENEKAFVIACIDIKVDSDKKERKKLESKAKKKRWWNAKNITGITW